MATILLIDDSESHRAGIRRVLQDAEAGLELLEASDGLQGLKLLMREAVDLVLCDLEMPKLDGEKLLGMRKSSPGGANIPFLFLSASTNLDRRAKLIANGASDAISKPYHPPELVARVQLHLKIKRLQDELMLKNATLERLSTVDGLTGLRTRRYVDEVVNVEFQRARRYATPLTIVMIDIDHFKRVNDDHGHAAGDTALRGVSAIIQGQMRNTDVAARFGGEEFVLVLPQNTSAGAGVLSERLREEIESSEFEIGSGTKVSVTASFGVAEFHADMQDAEDLVACADRALYSAKQRGRNQVRTAQRSEARRSTKP